MYIVTGKTAEPHVTSADDAALNSGFAGLGDYVLPNTELTVTQSSTNTFRLSRADILIQGVLARLEGTETVTIQNGDQGMYRIDSICATYQLDSRTKYEEVYLQVIKGTPSSTREGAVPPSLTSGSVYNGDFTRDARIVNILIFENSVVSTEVVIEKLLPISALGDALDDIRPYSPGERVSFDVHDGGYLTTNKTEVRFTMQLNKPISKNVKSVTITNAHARIRQSNDHIVGTKDVRADATISVTKFGAAGIVCKLTVLAKDTALNNDAVGVEVDGTFVFNS